jgi:hypothetical protein
MSDKTDLTGLRINGYDCFDPSATTAAADGAITAKSGVVAITKSGVAALTLANPTAGTDDFKILRILSTTANAHTVTCTGGFGEGGALYDVATFAAAKGAALNLMAYQGFWYVIGAHAVTIA